MKFPKTTTETECGLLNCKAKPWWRGKNMNCHFVCCKDCKQRYDNVKYLTWTRVYVAKEKK